MPGSIFRNSCGGSRSRIKSAVDPQGFFDGNLGVVQTYHPGMQIDGAVGIVYNNWYNVLGFDKITPLAQVIVSHKDSDSGTGSDPLNSGFDRVMLSPGIEFTKVLDEANKHGAQDSTSMSRSRSTTGPTPQQCGNRRSACRAVPV